MLISPRCRPLFIASQCKSRRVKVGRAVADQAHKEYRLDAAKTFEYSEDASSFQPPLVSLSRSS